MNCFDKAWARLFFALLLSFSVSTAPAAVFPENDAGKPSLISRILTLGAKASSGPDVNAAVAAGNFGVKVSGLDIIFPDSDYYQVQVDQSLVSVFEGWANPDVTLRVAPGNYHIINLTTGARVNSVAIRAPKQNASTPSTPRIANASACESANTTISVNYNQPVQYGNGPYIVQISGAGSNATGSSSSVLEALDSEGRPVGSIRHLGLLGDRRTNYFVWSVGSSGPDLQNVYFAFRHTEGSNPCIHPLEQRRLSQADSNSSTPRIGNPQPQTPPPSIDSPEIPEIELLQRSEGVLAFPGAVGFGRNAVGGRNGRILTVNTVENIVDDSDNFLSLREAITVEKGPRTVVFAVGGVFDTGQNQLLDILGKGGNSGSYLTVACQSAPSPGVVIKTFGFNVELGAHDLVFRHCAVRGTDSGRGANNGRGVTIRGGSKNIVFDHMSFSWATDEGFQVYVDRNQTEGTNNITLSNSIVAEGDADSSHPMSIQRAREGNADWGYHAMGPGCNNSSSRVRPLNCSIVNNYIAHNSSRNGMIWGGSGEISNNVIYNWYGIGVTAQPFSGSGVDVIVNNNLMKSGPNTEGGTSNPSCGAKDYRCALYLGPSNSYETARYSVGKNYYIAENKSLSDVQEMNTHVNANSPHGRPNFSPKTPSPVSIVSMAAKGSRFMNCVGASRPSRDIIDSRVINEFHLGTGAIGIGQNIRNGGQQNVTKQRTFEVYGAPTSHSSNHDRDKDGMADVWETNYGLNANNPDDHRGDRDGDGYTNIEEYLAIAAFCQ